jgi:hypothetical protein
MMAGSVSSILLAPDGAVAAAVAGAAAWSPPPQLMQTVSIAITRKTGLSRCMGCSSYNRARPRPEAS